MLSTGVIKMVIYSIIPTKFLLCQVYINLKELFIILVTPEYIVKILPANCSIFLFP